MIPETHRDFLDWATKAFPHVATIGPARQPQNNPVWFDRDDEYVHFSQTTTRQKSAILHRDEPVTTSTLERVSRASSLMSGDTRLTSLS